jgi:hypothetical protein
MFDERADSGEGGLERIAKIRQLLCDIEGNLHEISHFLPLCWEPQPLKRRKTRGNVYKLTSTWIRRASEIRQRSLGLVQIRWAIEKLANTMRRIEGYARVESSSAILGFL